MECLKIGVPFEQGVFLSVPPSHGLSLKNAIMEREGRKGWSKFIIISYIDQLILGKVIKPFKTNFFGFEQRFQDIRKGIYTRERENSEVFSFGDESPPSWRELSSFHDQN